MHLVAGRPKPPLIPKTKSKNKKSQRTGKVRAVVQSTRSGSAAPLRFSSLPKPSLSITGDSDGVRVTGVDVVQEFPTSGPLTWMYFWANPANSQMFPKLSQLAQVYDRFRIESLELVYYPACAMTTPGQIALAFSEDPADGIAPDIVSLANYRCSAMGNVASPLVARYAPKSAFNLPCFTSTHLPDPTDLVAASSPLYTGLVRAFVMLKDGPSTPASAGYLAVKYVMHLYAFRPTPTKALASLTNVPQTLATDTFGWLKQKWTMAEGIFNTANGLAQLYQQWVAGGPARPGSKPAIQDSFTLGQGSYSVSPMLYLGAPASSATKTVRQGAVSTLPEETSYYIDPSFDIYHLSADSKDEGIGYPTVANDVYVALMGWPLDGLNVDGSPATQAVTIASTNMNIPTAGVFDTKWIVNLAKAYRCALSVCSTGATRTTALVEADVTNVSSYSQD